MNGERKFAIYRIYKKQNLKHEILPLFARYQHKQNQRCIVLATNTWRKTHRAALKNIELLTLARTSRYSLSPSQRLPIEYRLR